MTRLIDADALVKAFNEAQVEFDEYYKGLGRAKVITDNAPTVVAENATSDRPQGEWVEKQETPASVSYYCSNCKMSDLPVLPYCPWCGAKMKGVMKNEIEKEIPKSTSHSHI